MNIYFSDWFSVKTNFCLYFEALSKLQIIYKALSPNHKIYEHLPLWPKFEKSNLENTNLPSVLKMGLALLTCGFFSGSESFSVAICFGSFIFVLSLSFFLSVLFNLLLKLFFTNLFLRLKLFRDLIFSNFSSSSAMLRARLGGSCSSSFFGFSFTISKSASSSLSEIY